jgi:hypothetical protein
LHEYQEIAVFAGVIDANKEADKGDDKESFNVAEYVPDEEEAKDENNVADKKAAVKEVAVKNWCCGYGFFIWCRFL